MVGVEVRDFELPTGKREQEVWLTLPAGRPELAARGPATAPRCAMLPDGSHLIVFRTDVSIGYAHRDAEGTWRRGAVARAQEIIVRDRKEQDEKAGRHYPAAETLGEPSLTVDAHGVAWCFWHNARRRHTYRARWLGARAGFTTPVEATRVGYALGLEVPTIEPVVAPLSAEAGRRVLLADLLSVAELRGAELQQGRPTKRPTPIVTPEGVRGRWRGSELRPLGAPRVWRDGGRLLMELGARGPMGNGLTGRLESDDGLEWHWCPPHEQGMVIDSEEDDAGECKVTWFLDEAERDEGRRYKGALVRGVWTNDRRRWLVTSPDGVRWRVEAEMEGMHHLAEHGGPSFRDPRTGEYVAVGRTSASGHRALGMLRSDDLIQWRGGAPLRDVDDPEGAPPILRRGHPVAPAIIDPAGEPQHEQIYWGTVWPQDGMYLCLYGRYHWDARYEACLALSQDGQVFQRPFGSEPFLPTGAPGEWDSGLIFMDYGVTRPVPFPERGSVRLYYGGSTWRHGADPYRAPAAVGVAELREDGWAYIQPTREAVLPATVLTVPIQAAGRTRVRIGAEGPVTCETVDVQEDGTHRLRFTLHSHRSKLFSFRWEAV